MRTFTLILFVFICSILSDELCSSSVFAKDAAAKSCPDQADVKHLAGAERDIFLKTCAQGALAPARATAERTNSRSERALTKPSGVDRTVRSKQCSAEARRRRLDSTKARAFRLACLATAAPVRTTGTEQTAPAPSHAKDDLGVLPR